MVQHARGNNNGRTKKLEIMATKQKSMLNNMKKIGQVKTKTNNTMFSNLAHGAAGWGLRPYGRREEFKRNKPNNNVVFYSRTIFNIYTFFLKNGFYKKICKYVYPVLEYSKEVYPVLE